jgi:hypothetical protein
MSGPREHIEMFNFWLALEELAVCLFGDDAELRKKYALS